MFSLFNRKKKPELYYKSRNISIMYLDKAKYKLQKELDANQRTGEDERWVAEHDIKCIEETIQYLKDTE